MAWTNSGVQKLLALSFGLLLCLYFACAYSQIERLDIETNFLQLLPQTQRSASVEKASEQQQKQVSNQLIWLVSSKDKNRSHTAAKALQQALQQSQLFAQITSDWQAKFSPALYRKLQQHSFFVLHRDDRSLIQTAPQDYLQQRLQDLYSPLAMAQLNSLELDPLYTAGRFFDHARPQLETELYRGSLMLQSAGQWHVLLTSEMPPSPDLGQYRLLYSLYQQQSKALEQQGIELAATGLPLYNAFGANSAEGEISTIGVASVVGIVLLIALAFKSLRPLLLALSSIGLGIAVAFTTTLWLFGSIHLLTLVFGASLIGISIDYSFHYFCENNSQTPGSPLSRILPSISLGMLSSVTAFACLYLTPFPGLQQMAVFAACGLITAWLGVVCFYPLLLGKPLHHSPRLFHWLRYYHQHWPSLLHRRRNISITLFVVVLVLGLSQIRFLDDVRDIQSNNQQLKQQEQHIRQVFKQQQDGQFFIVQGTTRQSLITAELKLTKALQKLVAQQRLQSYQALSSHYPSIEQQRDDNQLLRQHYLQNAALAQMLMRLGMPESKRSDILSRLEQQAVLRFDDWLAAAPENLQPLFLGCQEQCYSVVRLSGISDLSALQALASNRVQFVDPVASINQVFIDYRSIAAVFILLGIVLISAILLVCLGIEKAVKVVAIALSSVLFSLASLSLLNYSISMFNIFALLLVLGISLDYAIFSSLSQHQTSTSNAVLLSLVTSLLAFGLLATSQTQVIHDFGLTLTIGMLCAFALAPLAYPDNGEQQHDL